VTINRKDRGLQKFDSCANRMNPQKAAMSHLSNACYYLDGARSETQKVLPENGGFKFHPNLKLFLMKAHCGPFSVLSTQAFLLEKNHPDI
jgi:hypothetical protein